MLVHISASNATKGIAVLATLSNTNADASTSVVISCCKDRQAGSADALSDSRSDTEEAAIDEESGAHAILKETTSDTESEDDAGSLSLPQEATEEALEVLPDLPRDVSRAQPENSGNDCDSTIDLTATTPRWVQNLDVGGNSLQR